MPSISDRTASGTDATSNERAAADYTEVPAGAEQNEHCCHRKDAALVDEAAEDPDPPSRPKPIVATADGPTRSASHPETGEGPNMPATCRETT
jgi:hypothetical protein